MVEKKKPDGMFGEDGTFYGADGSVIPADQSMENVLPDHSLVKDDDAPLRPEHRTIPIHAIKEIYAKEGSVVIVGRVGGEEKEVVLTRKEAIERAQALSQMRPILKDSSDQKSVQDIIEEFIVAIKQAKKQAGDSYNSVRVAMYNPVKKTASGLVIP